MSTRNISTHLGKASAISDVGMVRSENQDYYAMWETPTDLVLSVPALCLALADGMGGHQGGSTASREALQTIENHFTKTVDTDITNRLDDSLFAANNHVFDLARHNSKLAGMGTTCTVVIVTPDKLHIAHVGDSRCYEIVDGEINQITKDHLYVQELLENGAITAEQAAVHPDQNVLSRALGTFPNVDIDIYTRLFQTGTKLLLCSDGLNNYLSDQEIKLIVEQHTLEEANQKLVQVAKERGGADNITVIIAEINYNPDEDTSTDTYIETKEIPSQFDSGQSDTEAKNRTGKNIIYYLAGVFALLCFVLIAIQIVNRNGPDFSHVVRADRNPIRSLLNNDSIWAAEKTNSSRENKKIDFNNGDFNNFPIVTAAKFCAFLNANGNSTVDSIVYIDLNSARSPIEYRAEDGNFVVKPGYEDRVVNWVTWYGAISFCQWADGKLPNYDQWVKLKPPLNESEQDIPGAKKSGLLWEWCFDNKLISTESRIIDYPVALPDSCLIVRWLPESGDTDSRKHPAWPETKYRDPRLGFYDVTFRAYPNYLYTKE